MTLVNQDSPWAVLQPVREKEVVEFEAKVDGLDGIGIGIGNGNENGEMRVAISLMLKSSW